MNRAVRILCALFCAICLANAHCLAAAPADVLEPEYAYIQEGDTGRVVSMLQAQLSVDEKDASDEALFGEQTLSALLSYQQELGLEATGVFDDATLMLLLDVPADAKGVDLIRWVPMHGGIKFHAKPECSGMVEPRQMSQANAAALGFTACKRCIK